MIEFWRNERGQPRATATCDEPGCGGSESFACKLEDVGQARNHMTKIGWKVSRKRMICPEHQQKDTGPVSTKPTEQEAEARRPSRQQKREIMDMLQACYDTASERYEGSETDDSVASALNVLPAWVEEIREEFFGPVGSNADIDALTADLNAVTRELGALKEQQKAVNRDLRALVDQNNTICNQMNDATQRLANLETRFERVKSALGARTRAKAAV